MGDALPQTDCRAGRPCVHTSIPPFCTNALCNRNIPLNKRQKLPVSTLNTHCYKSNDYISHPFPFNKMFGLFGEAYFVLDTTDKRYTKEARENSAKLQKLYYDKTIISNIWKEIYCKLDQAEKRHADISRAKKVPPKVLDEAEGQVKELKKQLLMFQNQRDGYEASITKIFDRFADIKKSIDKENNLESVRTDQTQKIMAKYPQNSPFWSATFNVSTASGE